MGGLITGKRKWKMIPTETDAEKLVNHCCGTDLVVGTEPVKLGADEDYPSWIWKLRLGPPPSSYELDPSTKEYWKTLDKESIQKKYYLRYVTPVTKMVCDEGLKRRIAERHRHRFRALAFQKWDPGFDVNETEEEFNKIHRLHPELGKYFEPATDEKLYP